MPGLMMPARPHSRRYADALAAQAERARLRRAGRHERAGHSCLKEKRFEEAIAEFRASLALDPKCYGKLLNLGATYTFAGRGAEAIEVLWKAVTVEPRKHEAWDNLGVALSKTTQIDLAIECHREALRHSPGNHVTTRNLGAALEADGQAAGARDCFAAVLANDPADTEARLGHGLARLVLGDLDGMHDLDARLDRPTYALREMPGVPRWDGRPLSGTLLINQKCDGFGDCFHGIRAAKSVRRKVGRTVLLCATPVLDLMRYQGLVDEVYTNPDDLPPLEAQTPALSLPWYSPEVGPDGVDYGETPYLRVDGERWREWSLRLDGFGHRGKLRVGIVWQGDPTHGNDRRRSFALAEFESLAAIPGVSLVSLQKGCGVDQIGDSRFPVADLCEIPAYRDGDYHDAACAIKCLDLVVTPDTGIAHLAAAMGVRTWIAIPRVPEWRWQIGREDSPWYRAARLFRQPREGDWPAVFTRMADEVASGKLPVASKSNSFFFTGH